ALFYVAVHYLQAYFASLAVGPITSHTQRDSAIRRDRNIRSVYVDYQELKTHSRDARYEAVPGLTLSDLQKQQANLAAIKSVVSKFI
ncbi:MAG TPA: hypothetical protein VK419_16525, partial [Bryobacteraceae bacterium]|nr:hypothetical protein [Bryobacteraceae bacterium]